MEFFIQIFILIPLLGLLVGLLLPTKNEKIITQITFLTMALHWASTLIFLLIWIVNWFPILNSHKIVLYQWENYSFFIDFFFDKLTAVYLFVGSLLSFMVVIYSRHYLHHEKGYKRFFNTILFFFLGYNVVIFSGNFETMFIGWEILGISSFLLIAFYRERFLPIKNALKVFSIYRVGDVGIILAMWLSHHLWHENITFLKLQNYELVHEHLQNHSFMGTAVALALVLAAIVKSAQLPFSSWLARAMEGPTPSSAIFYGSLSVHMGVFLLIRTFPFWEHQISVRILIGLLGLTTALVTTFIARVQSTIKSQIAYASISQIGIIFVEIALGLDYLALFHFAGNAFLRTYQFIISPSVVTYLIREQFYNYVPKDPTIEKSFPKRLQYSFYVLSLKEWGLDSFMYRFLWQPLKILGRKLDFLTNKFIFFAFIGLYFAAAALLSNPQLLPPYIVAYLPISFSLIGLFMVLRSFTERKNPILAWLLIIMNHLWVALAISFNGTFTYIHILIYLSGIVGAGFGGLLCLFILRKRIEPFDMNSYYGYSEGHSLMDKLFLLACLGMAGFPISPTFLGLDLIFSHIKENQIILAFFTAMTFIINGIAIIRIYARLFLGKKIKPYESVAYRSS